MLGDHKYPSMARAKAHSQQPTRGTQMSTQVATTEEIVDKAAHGNPILKDAIKAALDRSVRYRIPASRYHDKMGVLWLVAGGPRNQTYWTEERIIAKAAEHDPACTPAYLCEKCIDAIINAVSKPNKDEINQSKLAILHEIHAKAQERAEGIHNG
jgi:hypothetical protein